MRVFVAGATGTFGRPMTDALARAGHHVTCLTRSAAKGREIAGRHVEIAVGDAFDREGLITTLAAAKPEVVISLLITLPKTGPLRPSHVHPNLPLWGVGVPNLIEAAKRAGARRIIAESFVFAYGYGQYGPKPLTEEHEPSGGAEIRGQAEILEGLREMERAVRGAEGVEGVVLRFGGRHGIDVPMRTAMARALRWRVPVLPGGGHALLPFIELGDSVAAIQLAMTAGERGQIYNIVDDEAMEMRDYAAALATSIGAPRPRAVPLWLTRPIAPYLACVLDHTRMSVSNRKAKLELGWGPRYPTIHDAFAAGVG